MKPTYSSYEEAERSFILLFEECSNTCLWFWRRALVPSTTSDRNEALRLIEQNGTLQQFTKARELRTWL